MGNMIEANTYTKSRGFTIVELLIVIVVIAILAAITVVAYNGIQNRANDVAVQSDISALAKKVQLDQVDRGNYISGGGEGFQTTFGNSGAWPGMTFSPSKAAYATNTANLYYCTGYKSGVNAFVVAARSKSGTNFGYNSQSGNFNQATSSPGTICQANWDTSPSPTFSYGYLNSNNTWNSWIN